MRGAMVFGALYFGVLFYWILVALIWFTKTGDPGLRRHRWHPVGHERRPSLAGCSTRAVHDPPSAHCGWRLPV